MELAALLISGDIHFLFLLEEPILPWYTFSLLTLNGKERFNQSIVAGFHSTMRELTVSSCTSNSTQLQNSPDNNTPKKQESIALNLTRDRDGSLPASASLVSPSELSWAETLQPTGHPRHPNWPGTDLTNRRAAVMHFDCVPSRMSYVLATQRRCPMRCPMHKLLFWAGTSQIC